MLTAKLFVESLKTVTKETVKCYNTDTMFIQIMQSTNHPKARPSHECMQIYIVQLLLLRVTKGPIPSTICTFHKNNRR